MIWCNICQQRLKVTKISIDRTCLSYTSVHYNIDDVENSADVTSEESKNTSGIHQTR